MKIHWIMPTRVAPGSGGTRTIAQVASELGARGNAVTISVANQPYEPPEVQGVLEEFYDLHDARVVSKADIPDSLDVVVATAWDTFEAALDTPSTRKAYFVQDFEPWFMPMGYEQVRARLTYSGGVPMVTIGNWLPAKLAQEANAQAVPFDFCVNRNVYKRDEVVKKHDTVCVVIQPEKPRRCTELLLKAMRILKQMNPGIVVCSYGSTFPIEVGQAGGAIDVELGLLSIEECAKLYNECKVGICCSSSNPSRIPFEMMACGLPVVDLHVENNLYDIPADAALLAYPNPASIAGAVLHLLDNEDALDRMSRAGQQLMANRTIEREQRAAAELIELIGHGEELPAATSRKLYDREPFTATDGLQRTAKGILKKHAENMAALAREAADAEAADERRQARSIARRVANKLRRS